MLQAFARTKLVEAAFLATGFVGRLQSATMRAKGSGLRLEARSGFSLGRLNLLGLAGNLIFIRNVLPTPIVMFLVPPIIVFLNGKGGGEQVLEGLLVQREVRRRQIGPA